MPPEIIFRVTAQDETQSGIASATLHIEQLGATAQQHTPTIAGVGNALEKTGEQGKTLSGVVQELSGHFGSMATAITGVGAVLVGGELFKGAIEKATEFGNEIFKLRTQLGGTSEDASKLRAALDDALIPVDSGTAALTRLSRALQGAAEDSDGLVIPTGKIKDTIKSLGIDVTDTSGHIKNMSDILPQLSDRFAAMADGAEKNALGQLLFGRSFTVLLPLLNEGHEAFTKSADAAERYGQILSDKDVAALRDASKANNDFHDSLEGLQIQFALNVIPLLTQAAAGLTDMIMLVHDAKTGWEDFTSALSNTGPLQDIVDLLGKIPGATPAAHAVQTSAASSGGGGIDWGRVLRGALVGGAGGAVVGSVVPGLGTVPVAIGGAIAGGIAGGVAGHAGGGPAQGLFVVGEAGPEVVYAPGGAHVFSSAQSGAMGLLGGGLPGYRSGTGNSIADEISDWADAHDGLGGLTAQQLAEGLIMTSAYETSITNPNTITAKGPFSFDATGLTQNTYGAATRLGYDVHTAAGSLNYFLEHDRLSAALAQAKSDLDAGAAPVDAYRNIELMVERPLLHSDDPSVVTDEKRYARGDAHAAYATARALVAKAYANGGTAAVAAPAAAAAAQITAPGVGASDASQGVIGIGGGGGVAAGSSPGGDPNNPDISGGAGLIPSDNTAGAVAAAPASPGGGLGLIGAPITGGVPIASITGIPGLAGTLPTPSGGPAGAAGVVVGSSTDPTGGLSNPAAAALAAPTGGLMGGGAISPVAAAQAVGGGAAGPQAAFDWPAEQARLSRMAQPGSSGAQLYTLARLIATLVEQGNGEAAVRMLATVPAAGFDTLISQIRAIIEADLKASGSAIDALDPRLANIAERAAPLAAANIPPPAFPQGLFQQQIDAQLHPQGVQAQVQHVAEGVAVSIESQDIPGAIRLLSMVPKDNFDSVVAQTQTLIQSYATQNRLTADQLTELMARLNAAESGAAGTVAASKAPGYVDTSQPVPFNQSLFDQQIANVLHPKSIAAQVFAAAQAIAVAVETGNRAGAIHLLSLIPPDDFDQVISQARSFLQDYATQHRLAADQLAALAAGLNAAEAAAAPSVATSTLPGFVEGGAALDPPWTIDPKTGQVIPRSSSWGANAPGASPTALRPGQPGSGFWGGNTGVPPAAAGAAAPTTVSHVTVNVHPSVPTSSTDPALASLIRALDEYLKRLGAPGLTAAA